MQHQITISIFSHPTCSSAIFVDDTITVTALCQCANNKVSFNDVCAAMLSQTCSCVLADWALEWPRPQPQLCSPSDLLCLETSCNSVVVPRGSRHCLALRQPRIETQFSLHRPRPRTTVSWPRPRRLGLQ